MTAAAHYIRHAERFGPDGVPEAAACELSEGEYAELARRLGTSLRGAGMPAAVRAVPEGSGVLLAGVQEPRMARESRREHAVSRLMTRRILSRSKPRAAADDAYVEMTKSRLESPCK